MAGTVAITAPVVHRNRGVVRIEVALTTDASGDTTEAVVGVGYGRLVGVLYDGGLDASAVITVKDYKTAQPIIAYTTGTEATPVAFRPTTNVVTNAGATIAADAVAPNVMRDIEVAGKLSVTVASGGNAETGKIALIIDEANLTDGPALTV